jgi:hypothetical protein
MSFPTVQSHLEGQGVTDVSDATDEQLHAALIRAFDEDLPAGMAYLREQAQECLALGDRVLRIEDPNSPLGKQIARLCGSDIGRKHVEQEFGVAIGFYNCCSPVMAPTRAQLQITEQEQIMLQNGQLAHADC